MQVVLRQSMPKEVERAWAERVVRAMHLLFPRPDVANWEVCRQLLPHVHVCAALIEDWQMTLLEGAALLHHGGWYLKERADYHEAQSYNEQALAIRRTVLGEQHPSTANSLNNLASVYERQGRYAEAEAAHQQALAIYHMVLGEYHADTAMSLNNLAGVYQAQGKYAEAEAAHQQALAIKRAVLGEQHPDTALSLNNLGELYAMQGKNADALPLFERALAILQRKLGPEHPHTKMAQDNVEQTVQAMKREAGVPGMDAEHP